MRKSPRILLAALCCALLAGLIWLALRETEPHYKGKPLSYWLQAYDEVGYTISSGSRSPTLGDRLKVPPSYEDLEAAMKTIGTNAIPTLLRLLRSSDSPATQKLQQWAARQKWLPIHFTPAETLVAQGTYGIRFLGGQGLLTVPELMHIYETAPEARKAILECLPNLKKDIEAAIPTLMRALGAPASPRAEIIRFFSNNTDYRDPDLVVPHLIPLVNDPDLDIQQASLVALFRYSSDKTFASSPHAVPVLNAILPRFAAQYPSYYQRMSVVGSAAQVLRNLGPAAKPAVPLLLEELDKAEIDYMRGIVIETLGRIAASPELVVPRLIKILETGNSGMQRSAMWALGPFRADAKAAVPAIERLMQSTGDAELRRHCSNTLHQILGPPPAP